MYVATSIVNLFCLLFTSVLHARVVLCDPERISYVETYPIFWYSFTDSSLILGSLFICYTCGKTYRWKRGLDRHTKNECGKDPQFSCPHCDYRSKHKSHVRRHIRNRHHNCLQERNQQAMPLGPATQIFQYVLQEDLSSDAACSVREQKLLTSGSGPQGPKGEAGSA